MTGHAQEERLRQLERDSASAIARLDGVEAQQRATWGELRRLSREGRDEFAKLREELKADREQQRADNEDLRELIIGNKLAGAALNGGLRMLSWGIATLIALGGLVLAVVHGIRKLFTD